MKEIESLIKRAERYIKSAKLLIDDGDYESAVSRIYYAMFFTTEAVLLTKDLSFSTHKSLISGFGEYFIKNNEFPRDMGRELNRAFEKRQLGDYGYTFVVSKEEAEEMFESGQNFIQEITNYLKEKSYFEK